MSIEPDLGQATGRGSIPVDSFGNRLMLARAHAGHISIREAADLCDIGRGAWTNWEKGARPVDIIETAEIVAEKLGVDREWLLFGGPLGQIERRSLRRASRSTGTTRRTSALNVNLPHIPRSAHVPSARAGSPFPRTGSRPNGQPRKNITRPGSPVPATRRRPVPVQPPKLPSLRTGLPMSA